MKESKKQEQLKWITDLLEKIETDIKRAKLFLEKISEWEEIDFQNNFEDLKKNASNLLNYEEEDEVKVIEWIYDGYFMVWSNDKNYPVPTNYASKTKLIPWDVLKLKIMKNWQLIYKVISQAQRKFIKATLSKTDDEKYTALTDEGKTYYLNHAAVTYFKAKPGDELSIIINEEEESNYAAIEALISSV